MSGKPVTSMKNRTASLVLSREVDTRLRGGPRRVVPPSHLTEVPRPAPRPPTSIALNATRWPQLKAIHSTNHHRTLARRDPNTSVSLAKGVGSLPATIVGEVVRGSVRTDRSASSQPGRQPASQQRAVADRDHPDAYRRGHPTIRSAGPKEKRSGRYAPQAASPERSTNGPATNPAARLRGQGNVSDLMLTTNTYSCSRHTDAHKAGTTASSRSAQQSPDR